MSKLSRDSWSFFGGKCCLKSPKIRSSPCNYCKKKLNNNKNKYSIDISKLSANIITESKTTYKFRFRDVPGGKMKTNLYEDEYMAEEYISRRRRQADQARLEHELSPRPSGPGLLRRLLAALGLRMISTGERLRALEKYDQTGCETC
jgi:hypothetical protein